MVFSSVPPYLDHHNWHHQLQQQSNHQQGSSGSGGENPNLPPPPPPPPQPGGGAAGGGGGGGGEGSIRPGSMVDRARLAKLPLPEPGLNCPRCDSTNTKFCYFNNYSLTQPRHFCKTCRRYWTRGGALRNVPVGGGCRRNKRNNKRSSKSPSQTGPNKSVSASPSRGSTDNMATTQLSHPPPPLQLPFMSSLSQYTGGGVGSSITSSIGGFQPQSEIGNFQLGSGSSSGNNFNNILSIGGGENWRLPFLAGFDVPNNNNLFHYQSEGMVEPPPSGIDNAQVEPPVKVEENRGLNLSRQFLGISENTSQQQPWVPNTWSDFSGVSTSSTPTTHFL